MTISKSDHPAYLTGGCLCGSIKYTLTFTDESPWPPLSSTCQCTMCRKWTSSLVAHFLVVQSSRFYPPLGSSPDFKEFESSPGRFRGFCGKCGTSLTWREEESGDGPYQFDLFLGTLDQQWLVEEKNVAKLLATPSGSQFWLENAIEGVTDTVKGGKEYLKARAA